MRPLWRAAYPWRCLCRGLLHTTRTTPLRRMILHLSHRFFTDAWTFIRTTPQAAPGRRNVGPSRGPAPALPACPSPDYLCNQTIRPRDRSYGVISTVTESPGMIRIYLMRILPQT